MRDFQRLEKGVLNILVEWFSRYTLKNIAGKRRGIVRVSGCRMGRKDSDGQMRFHVLIEWRKVAGVGHEELLNSLFESRGVGHDVAQCNRFGIGGWNLKIEVVVDVAIQVELSQLDLLHD